MSSIIDEIEKLLTELNRCRASCMMTGRSHYMICECEVGCFNKFINMLRKLIKGMKSKPGEQPV